ncbi:hypothetical protein Syun_018825 [Stephania yunnanensis]|uniref:Uncharacterized protein n=1 Tax=Stephania yunnanensis TaxID=152371 RepID=A0AAP0NW59_9MAGN
MSLISSSPILCRHISICSHVTNQQHFIRSVALRFALGCTSALSPAFSANLHELSPPPSCTTWCAPTTPTMSQAAVFANQTTLRQRSSRK